jgi:type IV secretion system protein VirB5
MSNQKQVLKYTSEADPETPYTRAQNEWDDRIGSARIQAYNWRLAFFVSALTILILASGLIYMAGRQHAIPYIVKVDKIGRVQAVEAVTDVNIAPGKAEISYFLSQFVIKIRSITLDPVVVKQNWLSAYDFVSRRGENELNSMARQEDPFSRIGHLTASVDIETVVPISEKSYQVRWTEKITNTYGVTEAINRYTGIFTIAIKKPRKAEEIMKNPLGILIDSFNISQQISQRRAQ